MKIFHRRWGRHIGLVTAVTALGMSVMPSAGAQDPAEDPYPWAVDFTEGDLFFPPPWDEILGPIGTLGPIPTEALDTFRNCPDQTAFDIPGLGWCIVFRVQGGELVIGRTTAQIDPFEITVAVYAEDPLDPQPVVIMAPGGGGSPGAVALSGGILGVPELDAVVAADPLKLLSVTARPEVGAVAAGGANPAGVLGWATGNPVADPIVVEVPLSIRLENLLLGDACEIGPINLNLTNGPSGAMAGSEGEGRHPRIYEEPPEDIFSEVRQFTMDMRAGGHLVDNTFAVPGSSGCGLLVGPVLDDNGLQELNVFDAVVDGQAGLPLLPGSSHAEFVVDTFVSQYVPTGIGTDSWYQESLAALG